MKKFFIAIFLVAGVLVATYLVKPHQGIAPTRSDTQTENQPVITADHVKYSGQDGKNAFELLQAATRVEFKQYDFGVFVQGINESRPDAKHFWKLYVNGQESQTGADQVQTKNADTIEWKVEEITQ